MRFMRNLLEILHHTGNLLLVLLLLGVIALPSVSIGLINVGKSGDVLSSQSVRLNIGIDDAKSGKYYYDSHKDRILPRTETITEDYTEPWTIQNSVSEDPEIVPLESQTQPSEEQ